MPGPGFQKKVKENGSERDAERGCEYCDGLRVERVGKGIPEQVEPQEQKEQGQETHEAAEGSRQASANDQRLGVVSVCSNEGFSAHGSPLAGTSGRRDGFLDLQKPEVGHVRRNVFLLHDRAAGAAWIFSLDLAVRLDQNLAVTPGIGAMPLVP
jgi:hypothetical protein